MAHVILVIVLAARTQFHGFLPENRTSDNIPRNLLRINTSASVHSASLKLPQNQHLQKTGGGPPLSLTRLRLTSRPPKLQDAGVNATAYAAKLPGGRTSVIILNKDAIADLEAEPDLGRGVSGAVETEILHAPALDSREAHITTSTKTDSLKQGKCSVTVPHATGLRLTLT